MSSSISSSSSSSSPRLRIVDYKPELAPYFKSINREWIEKMFSFEAKDEYLLSNPDDVIIAPGGHVFFVELENVGLVGTCALLKTGEDQYELIKMGVLESARGHQAGHLLIELAIQKAIDIKARRLYLLTNSKCEPAIHLYKKYGFKHDAEVLREFGPQYLRCDVAMSFPLLK